ncbi:hypothetical protein KGF42_03295 [Clostridioides sp. ZZV15-6383]|uniref:hypothetical protein n=1 Tax=Clostridioides sp. ZZV15-6383 TaxID=2811498 RepID=UPI001D0FE4A9|nr:hypothetical protein [Clostridioides sp. ZZV15-6383]
MEGIINRPVFDLNTFFTGSAISYGYRGSSKHNALISSITPFQIDVAYISGNKVESDIISLHHVLDGQIEIELLKF